MSDVEREASAGSGKVSIDERVIFNRYQSSLECHQCKEIGMMRSNGCGGANGRLRIVCSSCKSSCSLLKFDQFFKSVNIDIEKVPKATNSKIQGAKKRKMGSEYEEECNMLYDNDAEKSILLPAALPLGAPVSVLIDSERRAQSLSTRIKSIRAMNFNNLNFVFNDADQLSNADALGLTEDKMNQFKPAKQTFRPRSPTIRQSIVNHNPFELLLDLPATENETSVASNILREIQSLKTEMQRQRD